MNLHTRISGLVVTVYTFTCVAIKVFYRRRNMKPQEQRRMKAHRGEKLCTPHYREKAFEHNVARIIPTFFHRCRHCTWLREPTSAAMAFQFASPCCLTDSDNRRSSLGCQRRGFWFDGFFAPPGVEVDSAYSSSSSEVSSVVYSDSSDDNLWERR